LVKKIKLDNILV